MDIVPAFPEKVHDQSVNNCSGEKYVLQYQNIRPRGGNLVPREERAL